MVWSYYNIAVGVILAIWGYIGIMEKRMETSIMSFLAQGAWGFRLPTAEEKFRSVV